MGVRLRNIVLFFLSFAMVFAAVRFWQEADYGAGARDSTGKVAEPSREIAFVANSVGGTVTLLDVEARKAIGTLNIVPDETRVNFFRNPSQSFAQDVIEGRGGKNYAQDTDLSRDGTVLFVSRGHLGDVAAFDIATGHILWRTAIRGVRADHMAISPDGTRLFVSAMIRGGDVVEALDTETGRKLGHFKTGKWPHDVHVSEDGKRVYSGSLGDMTKPRAERGKEKGAYRLTVADAHTLEVLEIHDNFVAGIRPFLMSNNGMMITFQESNSPSILWRDLETNEGARIIFSLPDGVSEDDWDFEAPHHGLARSKKGLCIAARATDEAIIIGQTIDDSTQVPVGDAPGWAAFAGDDLCLLPNNRSDDVSFVSVGERKEIARVPVGRGPKHITVGQVPLDVVKKFAAAAN